MRPVILASASPRRAELLLQMGVSFSVQPADVNEVPLAGEAPANYVVRLAREKALAASRPAAGAIVLGADTSVLVDEQILGKPVNTQQAIETLTSLSARTHQVVTGVAVAVDGYVQTCLSRAEVTFRELRPDEISAYVRSGEPMDKAGSYGIQGLGGIFVKHLQGSYSAVVGLPLYETANLLAAAGYPVWASWQSGQESLNE